MESTEKLADDYAQIVKESMEADDDRDDVIRKCFGDKKWIW